MKKNRSAPVRICLHKLKNSSFIVPRIHLKSESGTGSGSRSPAEWKTVDSEGDTFSRPDPRNQIKQSCINHNALIPMTETDFPSIPDQWHVCRQAAFGDGVQRNSRASCKPREENR
jgi:hypothetical protein